MILLIDVGNTNTHVGLAGERSIRAQGNFPTADWLSGVVNQQLAEFVGRARLRGAAACSVVPVTTPHVRRLLMQRWKLPLLELTPDTLQGVGINYPRPETIGPDRLANAVAVKARFGAPAVVVDFGTAVTFDVVDRHGDYVGGIIAPGLAAMTEYLHEKTALLPRIRIRDVSRAIGRSTEQAMLVGAVHGYRGLVRELIEELKRGKLREIDRGATAGDHGDRSVVDFGGIAAGLDGAP
jgi:type III pantothenate kinase